MSNRHCNQIDHRAINNRTNQLYFRFRENCRRLTSADIRIRYLATVIRLSACATQQGFVRLGVGRKYRPLLMVRGNPSYLYIIPTHS